jgi:hypothetical protein
MIMNEIFHQKKNPKIEEEIQHLGSSNGFGFLYTNCFYLVVDECKIIG